MKRRCLPLLLLLALVSRPAAGNAQPPPPAGAQVQRAAPSPSPPADRCGPQNQDAQQLMNEGMRLYQAALASSDKREQDQKLERSLRCLLAAQRVAASKRAKVDHPLGLVYER